MRKQLYSRALGLVSEEGIELSPETPEDWKVIKREIDPKRWTRLRRRNARRLALRILREAGQPLTIEALADLGPTIPANAELARRILSSLNSAGSRNASNSDGSASAFAAGFELAEWQRVLLNNIEFERLVAAREKQLRSLPNQKIVTDDEIRNALKNFPTQKLAAKRLGINTRRIRKRISAAERKKIKMSK